MSPSNTKRSGAYYLLQKATAHEEQAHNKVMKLSLE